MSAVTSRDGTSIAYDRTGRGPALILIGGSREDNASLAAALAEHFTVYNYDQRGYGASGDTQPYAVAREIEDIDALIAEAGGRAHVYGVSAGGALALEAAAAGSALDRIAVYEVPYGLAESPDRWREYVETITDLLGQGRRGDVFALFMRTAGSSDEDIAAARNSPMWPACQAIAHTRAYGAACLSDGQPPTGRLSKITQPTLVLTGTKLDRHMTRLRPDVFQKAADAIAASIPHAKRQTLHGQTHMVDAHVLAAALVRFFTYGLSQSRVC
ncbi:alpha/beta fold hydrolase [Rugosimonospora africana]|uniref:Alpha/beta hydrolase n=1 Tax=Rugosimonospora africana TaxID=556532 RepID=A0A8J3R1A5_9ACTN|nr:alpha/beta hydrolase [Rugosimonospora africana]GIH21165.1 alpha/beta hydrolase [Rugosimonospora africana]